MGAVWLTDLADIVRAAGVSVIEETYKQGKFAGKSWKQVGFANTGLVAFRHVLWHHDASPANQDSPGALSWMMYHANDGAGTNLTPAAACWVCSGCNGTHPSGTWHIYAAGLSNHAGRGCGGWGAGQSMNSISLGVETDHTFGESWAGTKKQAQLAGLRKGTAAIMAAYEIDPTPGLLFHKTWTDGGVDGVPFAPWSSQGGTRGRKNDIDGLNLLEERRIVADLIGGSKLSREERVAKLRVKLLRLLKRRDKAREAGDREALASVRTRISNVRARIDRLSK
jgi:hypothetical protein